MIPVWVYGALAAGAVAIGFGTGWQVRDWKADSDELVVTKAGIERGKEQQQLSDFKAGRYEDERDDAAGAAQGRDTEIRTIYRTNSIVVPAACEPHPDALRVLDTAILAAGAQTSGEPRQAVPGAVPTPLTVRRSGSADVGEPAARPTG